MKVHGKDPQDSIVYNKHLGETWLSISCPYLFLYRSSGYFGQIQGVILHFSFCFLHTHSITLPVPSPKICLRSTHSISTASVQASINSDLYYTQQIGLPISSTVPFSILTSIFHKAVKFKQKSNSIISYREIFLMVSFLKEKTANSWLWPLRVHYFGSCWLL